MKPEKLSFRSIKKMLTPDEMKEIMAGSGGCGTCIDDSGLSYGCYTTQFTCQCPPAYPQNAPCH